LTQEHLDFIQEHLGVNCALTLGNLIAKVRDEFDVVVCASTMDKAIRRFRYSLKRTHNIPLVADTPAYEA
jgi:transposase